MLFCDAAVALLTQDERVQGVISTLKSMLAHSAENNYSFNLPFSSSLSKMTPNGANMNSYILRSSYDLKRFHKGFGLRVLLHTSQTH